jgi:hypothetical protein
LHPLTFDLTPPGWLRSTRITLTPTYSTIPHGNRIFCLRPRFQKNSYGAKQYFGVLKLKKKKKKKKKKEEEDGGIELRAYSEDCEQK